MQNPNPIYGKDLYGRLGIDRSATESEIKKSYRKLALKYHPDRNPGNKEAEELFKEVAEAYEILGNPEKKIIYDSLNKNAGKGYTIWNGKRAPETGFKRDYKIHKEPKPGDQSWGTFFKSLAEILTGKTLEQTKKEAKFTNLKDIIEEENLTYNSSARMNKPKNYDNIGRKYDRHFQ